MTTLLLRICGVLAIFACAEAIASNPPGPSDTAERFVSAVNAADADELNPLIHVDALAARVIEGMPSDAPQRDYYLLRLQGSAATLGATLASQFAAGDAVAKVGRTTAEGPLVRITLSQGDGNVGHNYYRLRLHADGRIEDWYDYALAMWTSENLRFSLAILMSPGDLALWLFRDRDALEDAATMRLMAAHLTRADHAGAYKALQSLPAEFRNQRSYAAIAVMLSRSIGMAAYRENLVELARLYGDQPDMQFMLIDHYLLESKFEQMLAAVAVIEREFGTDESVLNNRCAALIGLARYDDALAACDAVLAIDASNDTALWTRVRLALAKQDAPLVVESLLRIEATTGTRMDLEKLGKREAYAGVRDAPEFQALLARRAQE